MYWKANHCSYARPDIFDIITWEVAPVVGGWHRTKSLASLRGSYYCPSASTNEAAITIYYSCF